MSTSDKMRVDAAASRVRVAYSVPREAWCFRSFGVLARAPIQLAAHESHQAVNAGGGKIQKDDEKERAAGCSGQPAGRLARVVRLGRRGRFHHGTRDARQQSASETAGSRGVCKGRIISQLKRMRDKARRAGGGLGSFGPADCHGCGWLRWGWRRRTA